MKRVINAFLSLVLIAAIMLDGAHYVYADTQEKNDVSNSTVTGKTSIINVQYSSNGNRTKALNDIVTAEYSYIMKKSETNTAAVDMNVTLFTRSEKYLAELSGTVELVELPSGFSFWEGPLDGVFLTNGKEIRIIVGFLQKADAKDVSLSFTFCVDEEERDAYPLLFSVGEGFITDEVNEEILSLQNDFSSGESEE